METNTPTDRYETGTGGATDSGLSVWLGQVRVFTERCLREVMNSWTMLLTVLFVAAGSIAGVAYLFMGQLLEGYNIRAADRYAFYVGGAWLLVLVAVVPHVPLLRGWASAILGLGLAVHNIGSYVVLSRI